MNYVVTRPFLYSGTNYAAGETIWIEGERQARLLIEQRYVAPVPVVQEAAEAVASFAHLPVRKLVKELAGIEDPAVLEAALANEKRATAQRLIRARLAELAELALAEEEEGEPVGSSSEDDETTGNSGGSDGE